MQTDLSLAFLDVVEQAAIVCVHTMGQGDRCSSPILITGDTWLHM